MHKRKKNRIVTNEKKQNLGVQFLYGTKIGNKILQWILNSNVDVCFVAFLKSCLSKPLIPLYIRKHTISMREFQGQTYRSFAEFFVRKREDICVDMQPQHLISPCDGWLSGYPIENDSSFSIKGFRYRLKDLMQKKELEEEFQGGTCLIFRLCASDYHHYCYIDDGFQGKHHYIAGELHSVQPTCCEKYPIYTLNRRTWSIMETQHFGKVIQIEIGALVVGGIVNDYNHVPVKRGMEKGHFELSGSTIVMLFQKNQIELLQEIKEHLSKGKEYAVKQGMWIGNGIGQIRDEIISQENDELENKKEKGNEKN